MNGLLNDWLGIQARRRLRCFRGTTLVGWRCHLHLLDLILYGFDLLWRSVDHAFVGKQPVGITALCRIEVDHVLDECLHACRAAFRRIKARDLPIPDLVRNGACFVMGAHIREPLGEHLNQGNARRKDVDLVAIHLSFEDFWCHIAQRPSQRLGRPICGPGAAPEISQFDVVLICEQNVVRLDVAMDDPFAVQIADPFENLSVILPRP
mmetsp:Transcript_21409/g.43410  ORF Transcript_21409/g.43410 Transcript_21409/m.43410 type:complete len:208 (+) Transcript_21409:850-1473(+)